MLFLLWLLVAEPRPPKNDADLRFWLSNMLAHHYSLAEMSEATGLSTNELAVALKNVKPLTSRVLPYPGGRHPRIGFLDGAVNPQRESKVSVFTPWDPESYVVIDLPEAIWSNLGLTYLAHTHVPTIWTKQNVELPKLEWRRNADGTLDIERTLPNKIAFGAKVVPAPDAVHMRLWLTNGTLETLRDLRVQNCVMLKGAKGFEQQTNDNKIFSSPYVACRSSDGQRWIITAWVPSHRAWANAPVPCLHSDPKFPDCEPGQTQHLRGWLSFYEGTNIQHELRRIDETGWREAP